MITRKALIAQLNAMNLDTVLCAGYHRTHNHRGYAAEVALASLVRVGTFGATTHATKQGKLAKNPKWFAGLYTEIAWATGDVTAGSILMALM